MYIVPKNTEQLINVYYILSVKFIRNFFVMLVIAAVGGSVFLFSETERKYHALAEVEPRAQAIYSSWLEQNSCNENLEPCLAYSEQFAEWRTQMEQYKQRKMQSPEFKGYLFLKELDEQHLPDLGSGGMASLAAACAILLLFTFLFARLLGGQKKNKGSYIKTGHLKKEPAFKQTGQVSRQSSTKPAPGKLKAQALLQKAAECAESNPAQAIDYLEQAIEGSLSTKLSAPALLLSGSLRLKNKIGEKLGREQLEKVISASPKSSEAEKAQMVLNTFK